MVVRKTSKGYIIKSKNKKKTLSRPYPTREQAIHRLQEIEYFKHKND